MAQFENATRFGAFMIPSSDREGRDLLLVVVAARFTIPRPGVSAKALQIAEEQPPPPRAEEYCGDPSKSSIKVEGQAAYTRPATDIYVWGHACAEDTRQVHSVDVSITVGPCSTALRVFGERVWERSIARGAVPSAPERFVRMPLLWEHSFGGVAASSTAERPVYEPRNPIGCGMEVSAKDAVGQRLPNIEDPHRLLSKLGDRPVPVGVGPISKHWQPRVDYAGTYDADWQRNRAPVWPVDFDEAFFCAAPEPLQARPHLNGGERVQLIGLHPEREIGFALPTMRFVSRSRFAGREVHRGLRLDGVSIDTDAMELVMYYRAAIEAPLSLVRHRETLLRLAEPWERGAVA